LNVGNYINEAFFIVPILLSIELVLSIVRTKIQAILEIQWRFRHKNVKIQ